MALPASGAISLSTVNVELGKSATAQISLNDSDVRGLFGKASGQISLSDGYGKSSTPSYRYVRWNITATRTPGITVVQASEFDLGLNGTSIGISNAVVTNPGGTNNSTEQPSNLVDVNTATKWAQLSAAPATLIFDLGTPRTFNRYRYATANDISGRDPISWTVAASNDGTTWTTLATVTNATITTSRRVYTAWFLTA